MFQAPEPWSGEISVAPILFVSSNPSIDPARYKDYPRAKWDNDRIGDYFDFRFGGSNASTIIEGRYLRSRESPSGRKLVKYWGSVQDRATELLARPAKAGKDYALTEVVRCKSRHETGVPEALNTCVQEYLEPTISASASRVIVGLGRFARLALCEHFSQDNRKNKHGPIDVAGTTRTIVLLPHPSARLSRKSFADHLTTDELDEVRSLFA